MAYDDLLKIRTWSRTARRRAISPLPSEQDLGGSYTTAPGS